MRNRGDYEDIRIFMRDVVQDTVSLLAKEKSVALESIRYIGLIETYNIPANFCLTREQFAEQKLGLSPGQYFKRAQVARLASIHPEVWDLLEKGELSVAVAVQLAAKMTCANKDMILENIPGMTKREAEGFLSRVTADGDLIDKEPEVEVRLTLKQSEVELLHRAREILAAGGHVPSDGEITVKALQDLLKKRDPAEKAKRAEARRLKKEKKAQSGEVSSTHSGKSSPGKESRSCEPQTTELADGTNDAPHKSHSAEFSPGKKPPRVRERRRIPAEVKHHVRLRDGGQCCWVFPNGERCPERMMLEFDHKEMVCRGGKNHPDNIRLLCRRHNQEAAKNALGRFFMERFTSGRGTR